MKKAKEFIAPLIESTSIFQDGLNLSPRDVHKAIEIAYLEGCLEGMAYSCGYLYADVGDKKYYLLDDHEDKSGRSEKSVDARIKELLNK